MYVFDDIDFKDIKAIQSSRNGSTKLQYFFHEFNNYMEKEQFVNLFSQVKKGKFRNFFNEIFFFFEFF